MATVDELQEQKNEYLKQKENSDYYKNEADEKIAEINEELDYKAEEADKAEEQGESKSSPLGILEGV
jgi:hypothetical protein